MTYTITYTPDNWQPLGASFYQTVHHALDSLHALIVVLESSPLSAMPRVREAALYHRDGWNWVQGERVDIDAVQVCEEAAGELRERVYGE